MGFELPKNNLEDKNKVAREQFERLPDRIKEIALKNNVNPETLATDSLRPEEVNAVEGLTDIPLKDSTGVRAISHKKTSRGGMTHAAIVAQKMEEKENKFD